MNGTPPTKYSWLGAAGVTSEPSSGLVTQDGTTYVPQTGRPLETQGTRVPAPEDAAAAYAITLAPWVIEGTAAVAQQLTNAEQAEKAAREAARLAEIAAEDAPLPEGPSEEGGGEEGGGGGGGGGCSGTNACAASVGGLVGYHEKGNGYLGCSISVGYGSEDGLSGVSGEIEIDGHWECGEAVTEFLVQTALLIQNSETGKWEEIGEPYDDPYFDVSSSKGDPDDYAFGCGHEHADYDAWIWGGQYGARYHLQWWAWGRAAEIRTSCHIGVSTPEPP